MNWDRIESNWTQLTGSNGISRMRTSGSRTARDQLASRIQERYGIASDDAWEQGRRFLVPIERETH